MKLITKVGNLKVFYQMSADFLGEFMNVYVINGTDIVQHEIFPDAKPKDAQVYADRLLSRAFDIVTLSDIIPAITDIHKEHNGSLLSGKIDGFSETEYFKRFEDNPKYYKHFTKRPQMKEGK